jgi:hypothetical protein
MAFERKVDSGGGDVVKFEKPGDSVTGFYVGSQPFPEGKFGPAIKHILKTAKGMKVVFAKEGSALDQLFSGEDGNLVRVTFASTKPSGKGNPTKIYTLDVDKEQTLDPAEMATSESTYDDEPSEDEEETEVTTSPAKAAPTARSPSTDARARAQALLKGNSKSV